MTDSEQARELNRQLIKTRMAFRQAVQRMLKRNDVEMTFEMLQVIHCLSLRQGVSQQYLADTTSKDKACLTNLINNLERKGWAERRRDETDLRNRLIFLTEEGYRMSDRVMPLLRHIYEQVGTRMSCAEMHACTGHLKTLNEAFDEI